jgi:hypothetical protein
MNYKDQLKNPKWQKKRLEIFQRDNFTCQLCGDTETELQVHHLKYSGDVWNEPNENLITYCKHCHSIVTDYQKEGQIVRAIMKMPCKDQITMYVYNDFSFDILLIDNLNDRFIRIETVIYIHERESFDKIIHFYNKYREVNNGHK